MSEDLPRFRLGHKVPENVYDTHHQPHKPIMTAPTPELAREYVDRLNQEPREPEED